MRAPVAGTIARGHLGARDPDPDVARLYVYLKPNKDFVTKNPLPLTRANLDRGRERYDIHCAICHGGSGRGNGPVGLRWPSTSPSSYLAEAGPVPFPDRRGADQKPDRIDERVQKLVDGELFSVITNGWATMPAYGHQVPVKDRWAIIHYIRALQLRVKK
jgi:mono/diheme cytochrome c family protein